jgi:Tol biopolymer transport system component
MIPSVVPDGSRIAVHQAGGQLGRRGTGPATGELRILTMAQNNDDSPQWTPDGTSLVYQSADFSHKLVTVRVDGLLTAP